MHPSRTLGQIVKIFLVLAASSAQPAHANKNREDLCGVSVHAADFPDIGNFSVIDGTFTVPTVNPIPVASGSEDLKPTIFNGVALCCGTDCATRLSVGVKVWPLEHGDMMPYTGMPVLDLSPGFGHVAIPGGLDIELNGHDTFWTRIEIKSSTRAQLTLTKFESPTSNKTVVVDLDVGTSDSKGRTYLIITHSGGRSVQFSSQVDQQPVLCGESAWWYLTDIFSTGGATRRGGPRASFSPALVGRHGLQTANKKSFLADLPLSGMARFWDMERGTGDRTDELCSAKGFVDSGMTMFHAPHAWGV